MNYEEFYKHLIFRNREIYVPLLNISIEKIRFLGNSGYNVEEQDKYLKKLYDDNFN